MFAIRQGEARARPRVHARVRGQAAVALLALVCLPAAHAAVVTSGRVTLVDGPTSHAVVDGADVPNGRLAVGGLSFANGQRIYLPGTLEVTAGSRLRIAYLDIWGDSTATTSARIDGAGTRVELAAPGTINRFGLGNAAGKGSLVVSGGAVLDGAAQKQRCDSGGACQNVVGAAAGGRGDLTITGAGSEAHFVRMFHVGQMNYNVGLGRRGEDTRGHVLVRDGALLATELPSLGGAASGSNLDGTERAFALVSVVGAGSRWQIGGSPFVGGATRLHAGINERGHATIAVEQGGQLQMLASAAGTETQIDLGTGGGTFGGVLAGAGTLWRVEGNGSSARSGWMHLGDGGWAQLRIEDGARFEGALRSVQLGLNGGVGQLNLDRGGVAALGTASVGVGSSGGSGLINLGNAGRVEAGRVEIGSQGTLTGSGTLAATEIVVNGGLVSPGQSPGSLRIEGEFSAGAGSRLLLEVQADGLGGFDIDRLLFDRAPELDGMAIEFHFLGDTDPQAFRQSGAFDIDRFISVDGGSLGDDAFDGVTFSARADAWRIDNFSFSAADGASFSATAIPLPAPWTLMSAALIAALGARRASAARHPRAQPERRA